MGLIGVFVTIICQFNFVFELVTFQFDEFQLKVCLFLLIQINEVLQDSLLLLAMFGVAEVDDGIIA